MLDHYIAIRAYEQFNNENLVYPTELSQIKPLCLKEAKDEVLNLL